MKKNYENESSLDKIIAKNIIEIEQEKEQKLLNLIVEIILFMT